MIQDYSGHSLNVQNGQKYRIVDKGTEKAIWDAKKTNSSHQVEGVFGR